MRVEIEGDMGLVQQEGSSSSKQGSDKYLSPSSIPTTTTPSGVLGAGIPREKYETRYLRASIDGRLLCIQILDDANSGLRPGTGRR
jgi:hypothetical protein